MSLPSSFSMAPTSTPAGSISPPPYRATHSEGTMVGGHEDLRTSTIRSLLELGPSTSDSQLGDTLDCFCKVHDVSTALVPFCGETMKQQVSGGLLSIIRDRTQRLSLLEDGSLRVLMFALRGCRILMRERIGVDALLSPQALELFVLIATKCKPRTSGQADAVATEAMRCVTNYLYGRSLEEEKFVSQGGLKTLLFLLAESASPSFHSAVCACLNNLLYENPKYAAVLDKQDPLPVLVPTLVWLVKPDSQPPRTQLNQMLELINKLLKILFILAINTTKEALSSKDQEMMTQLGCALTRMLFLPDYPAGAYEAKLNVVNLLTYAPTDLTDFLTANDAIRPLLDILTTQLDVALIEKTAPQAPTLGPILALLLRMTQSSKFAQKKLRDAIFPPERDLELRKEQQAVQAEFIQTFSGLQMAEDKTKFKEEYERYRKERAMHPEDAAPGTLRWKLMKLMTSLDSTVKRLATELMFLLCNSDKEEFSRRTGFGNAVALLKMKNFI